jgi:CelD/BcsL family acetyltransferase involved in cellulose biosynthesis
MTALTWRVLTRRDELEALEPAWRALLSASGRNEVFVSPPWMLTWYDLFGTLGGRELRCLAVEEDGALVGLAPLLRRRHWYAPGLPFRRLESLASGENEADAICSDHLTILARADREGPVAQALIEALASRQPGTWDELVIPLMDGSSTMAGILTDAARQAGWLAETSPMTEAPYISLPDTWDEYLARLSGSARYFLRKSLRDFEAWAEGAASYHVATTPAELEEGWRILIELHQGRWQGTGRGVFRSQLFLEFHRRIMRRFLESGNLELIWLCVRARPLAVTYNLLWGEKTAFYQCGRAMDLPPRIRPGIVLHARAIQRAIQAGRREYDFLGGAAHYKQQLSTASRPLIQLRISRPCLVESARQMGERAKAVLRPLVQRLKGTPQQVEERE